jgi:hypothetical protein
MATRLSVADGKKQVPVYYDDAHGWVMLSEEALPPHMLKAASAYVDRVNSDRARGMFGEKRRRVEQALVRLRRDGIKVVSSKQGSTLFQSTERVKDTFYSFAEGI